MSALTKNNSFTDDSVTCQSPSSSFMECKKREGSRDSTVSNTVFLYSSSYSDYSSEGEYLETKSNDSVSRSAESIKSQSIKTSSSESDYQNSQKIFPLSFDKDTVSPQILSYVDVTQKDDCDSFSASIFTRMIENMRGKYIRDEDSRLILIRRAETISDVLQNWVKKAFNKNGIYQPFGTVMPEKVKKRENLEDYTIDSPLNFIGSHFAGQLGASMRHKMPSSVIASPFIADIQTGMKITENIPSVVSWKIEPGLAGYIAKGLKPPKLEINLEQATIMTVEKINEVLGNETEEEFYMRIAKVVSRINFPLSETTLIIADESVIDAIIQEKIRNGQKLTFKQKASLKNRIPCLSMIHFNISLDGIWHLCTASLPGLLTNSPMFNTIPEIEFLARPIRDY